ncbi:MAG: short-chain dehydrogenase/reductase [Thermomicrobiales bacterium]|nr:short-chain dehydrogenase/reductase [Thermomicrobiales bacterium]MDF2757917.1 short-chain dehydrogenase/reductase [Thermomicrobiales bacterium]MDF3039910.1 short-chain dehydrogenase/reductase [Thermomicrobiales bacterium]
MERIGNLKEALADKTVLVTGAGRGLGHGVARGLAAYGATVVAVARTESELAELAETVRSAGGAIETIVADLASPAETARLASDVTARHGVDALINNAAILRMTAFLDLSQDAFEETLAVNLLAPVRLTRALLPAMLERGRGAIINVSSNAGIRPFADETDYCAAKYGLEGFSYSLAQELAPRNVSVNLVSPGYRIKPTSVTAAEFASWPAERQAEFRDSIDMADAFAYLAVQYPKEGGVTGQRYDAFALAEEVRRMGWTGNQRPSAPEREGIRA